MKPCMPCGATGFGHIDPEVGYVYTSKPCSSCNPDGTGRPPEPPKPERKSTLEWVDAPGKSTVDSRPEPPERYFSPQQIERQQREDLRRMAAEGMMKGRREQ